MSLFIRPGTSTSLEPYFYPRGWLGWNSGSDITKPAQTNLSLGVRESDNSYLVTVDVPGFTSDQVSISTEDDVLTIQAEREETKNGEDDHNVVWTERSYGKFTRSLKIPEHGEGYPSEPR